VIPNEEGARTTPSVVAWSKDGGLLIGQMAKRQAAVNPENTFYSVKRFIGRQPKEVEDEVSEVAYRVDATSSTTVSLFCPQRAQKLAPEDISAQVLRKLARDASDFLQAEVKKAVITVPAYFNDSQRQATKDAGVIAGLDVLRIVNEPTAASLAYGLEMKKNETIMVFDLGGGTFDVSILSVGDGVCEVLATSGDVRLGGDDFDKCIVDWLSEDFERREGIDLRKDGQALQRLTEAAEKAKVELSNVQESSISLPFIAVDEEGPKHIEESLSREQFERLSSDLIARCRGPVEQALKDSELEASDLDEVVLVGGSTRIAAVQALVRELSGGKEPNQSVNPDEVVAVGAAVQGGVLTGEVNSLVLIDVIPLSLSVATHNGQSSVFVPRNTRVPVKKTKIFSTFKDMQTSVEIKVVQGERQLAKDNKELGYFLLSGIPRAPMGVPQIEVTFDVDSNGILSVMAFDKLSKKEQTVTITGASTLAPDDVERKVKEAAEFAEEEARIKQFLFVRNDAEAAAYALEAIIRNGKDKLRPQQKDMLESKIMAVRDLLVEDEVDIALIKEITEDLQEEYSVIIKSRFTDMYDEQEGFKQPEEPKLKAKPKKKVL